MLTMNNQSFSKIMSLLNISTIKLAEELFISQSLVSRWKTGSRVLRAGTLQYKKVLNCFLEVNENYNMNILETFLGIDTMLSTISSSIEKKLILTNALNKFLLSPTAPLHKPPVFFSNNGSTFNAYTGIQKRVEILKNFFSYISSLPEKPNLYIKDLDYGGWHYDPTAYLFNLQYACKQYMDTGGHIYYFSDINMIQKNQYYSGWKFCSHPNLHPAYYTATLSAKTGWSYYLAKNHVSIMFFVPEEDPEQYYTAVYQDKITLDAHYNFLTTQYNKDNRQIPLNNDDKLKFAIEIAKLYDDNINPLFFLSKYPPFIFTEQKNIRELLRYNSVSGAKLKLCLNLYSFLKQEIINNKNLKKQFLCYKEDLDALLSDAPVMDTILSAILNRPIYLRDYDKKERFNAAKNMQCPTAHPNTAFHIVSKNNTFVYSQLGEIVTDTFVKYDKWCYTFHKTENDKIDARLTLDPTACSIRYEMFNDTLKKK